MTELLVLAAVVVVVLGGSMLTQATLGVGVIGGACLLGILARIAQAGRNHNKLMDGK